MTKTSTQRVQELRQRRAEQGLTEVRGIFLPPELHARLKAMARAIQGLPPKPPG